MQRFSIRNRIQKKQALLLDEMPDKLQTRIWNVYYINEVQLQNSDVFAILGENEYSIHQKILDSFGYSVTKRPYAQYLHTYFSQFEWYEVYDFIELHLQFCEKKSCDFYETEYNRVLQEEGAAYRIVEGLVIAITNQLELDNIEQSMNTPFDAVNEHIWKSLELFSNRQNPDYGNAVKEAISAVESLVNIITDSKGKGAVLGNTIKELETKGIVLHGGLKTGILSLYGYASDADGVRHGGLQPDSTTFDEAKFMIVICSSIVNFIISQLAALQNRK